MSGSGGAAAEACLNAGQVGQVEPLGRYKPEGGCPAPPAGPVCSLAA